jgi:hypothetical protein
MPCWPVSDLLWVQITQRYPNRLKFWIIPCPESVDADASSQDESSLRLLTEVGNDVVYDFSNTGAVCDSNPSDIVYSNVSDSPLHAVPQRVGTGSGGRWRWRTWHDLKNWVDSLESFRVTSSQSSQDLEGPGKSFEDLQGLREPCWSRAYSIVCIVKMMIESILDQINVGLKFSRT